MKTHNFKFNPNLLAVELKTTVINSSYHIQKTPKGTLLKDDKEEKFISNKYIYLGKLSDLTEEMAEPLVKSLPSAISNRRVYRDYRKTHSFIHDAYLLRTALESLMSGIESEVYLNRNPITHPKEFEYFMPSINEFQKQLKKWESAELRTFDKSRTILFKKV